ncbi:hypothetical protein BBJ28_00021030 [Nothophytophthora sp. Chile5]|nr:hypothetical protein BBJ28_00021030 [Nothophytophthora sp. Chile5]
MSWVADTIEITLDLVRRAEKAGYKAIVLTVDTPMLGHREPDVRNHFSLPNHLTMANFAKVGGEHEHGVASLQDSGLAHYVSELFDLTLNWKDVKWLKSITKLPVVVKGVLSPEDAKIAVEMGCEGILVSNHGARQLDGVSATIDALPGIVQAVDGRAEVYMDGGVRHRTANIAERNDSCVQQGEAGVANVLRILNEELKHAMLFSGTATLADIGYVQFEMLVPGPGKATTPSSQATMVKIVPGSDGTPLNVLEYEEYAKEYFPKNTYDYFASGSDAMVSLKENREAFKRLVLHPRVLRDVSNMDISTTVLGHKISTPVCVAPSSTHRMAHPDGEIASTSAAAKADTCFILSTMSTTSLEVRSLCDLITVRGIHVLALSLKSILHLTMANFTAQNSGLTNYADYVSDLYDQTLSWKDVQWLKSITKLPVVVKGVLSPEDAKIAVEIGCEGILVSNHGARQLDGVSATIDALPAIVQAVNGRAEVYMDGGVRRGTDVFKATTNTYRGGGGWRIHCMAQGEVGVANVLRILDEELKHAMLFSGTASLADIGCVV